MVTNMSGPSRDEISGESRTSRNATLQHIELLNRRITKLMEAREQAEVQLLHRAASEYRANQLTISEVIDLFAAYRDVGSQGKTRRWNAAFPVAYQAMSYMLRPNGPEGTWVGEWPSPEDSACPARGVAVVYVLFDEANQPCYVGSTGQFRARLNQHAKDGKKFARWQAHPCADRELAYQLEERLLRENLPYLNRRTGR